MRMPPDIRMCMSTSTSTPMSVRHTTQAKGASFSNFYVNTPVCCASRSELLSGRVAHNIRMPTPKGGCMHMNSNSTEWQANTVATGLQALGYRTALFGKYLNTHEWFCDTGVRVPPGWDRFFASCAGVYYGNTWNDQGKMITNDANLTGKEGPHALHHTHPHAQMTLPPLKVYCTRMPK